MHEPQATASLEQKLKSSQGPSSNLLKASSSFLYLLTCHIRLVCSCNGTENGKMTSAETHMVCLTWRVDLYGMETSRPVQRIAAMDSIQMEDSLDSSKGN